MSNIPAKIGTHSPTTWQGFMPTPFLRFSSEINPGINGKTRLQDAWDCDEATITTYVTKASEDAAKQEINAILKMQGTEVNVVDQFGVTFDGCLVLSARAIKTPQIGNGSPWEVNAIFVLQPKAEPPEGWKDAVA